MDDIVTITAGLPVDDPWVITNVNANVTKDLRVPTTHIPQPYYNGKL